MSYPTSLRVQFAHGLESSAQGNKARYLARHYEACTPAMDTSDFASCVAIHATTAANFQPDLLIGSSFGGAVAVALLARDLWRGPTLLLAPAALLYDPSARLPASARVTLVHARADAIVPFEHSRILAAMGDPRRVELIPCDDDHALSTMLAAGHLPGLIARALVSQVPTSPFDY